jgi:hypothetical protein
MVEVQGNDNSSSVASSVSSLRGFFVPCEFKGLVFVRYLDHVMYNRTPALVMKPQIREAVGWLAYECEYYITITWDRDADPPTLKGGDPKASGIVLLKSDILKLEKLDESIKPLLKEKLKWHLNSQKPTLETEFALPAKEAKNSQKRKSQ